MNYSGRNNLNITGNYRITQAADLIDSVPSPHNNKLGIIMYMQFCFMTTRPYLRFHSNHLCTETFLEMITDHVFFQSSCIILFGKQNQYII